MSIICKSKCIPYVLVDSVYTATVSSYDCDLTGCGSVISPPAFNVIVTVTNISSNIKKYTISLGPDVSSKLNKIMCNRNITLK